MIVTQWWKVMAWSYSLRCLRQLWGGKSDTLNCASLPSRIEDCIVSSVEGRKTPPPKSRRPWTSGHSICITDGSGGSHFLQFGLRGLLLTSFSTLAALETLFIFFPLFFCSFFCVCPCYLSFNLFLFRLL